MSALRPSFIIALLIALSVHEWAHALVAHRLGDPTAKEQGRLTLNPIAHLDLMGTILFFLVGFGWGKPVPIDPRYFKHWKRDTALVSIAGPVSNLIVPIRSRCAIGFNVSRPCSLAVGSPRRLATIACAHSCTESAISRAMMKEGRSADIKSIMYYVLSIMYSGLEHVYVIPNT